MHFLKSLFFLVLALAITKLTKSFRLIYYKSVIKNCFKLKLSFDNSENVDENGEQKDFFLLGSVANVAGNSFEQQIRNMLVSKCEYQPFLFEKKTANSGLKVELYSHKIFLKDDLNKSGVGNTIGEIDIACSGEENSFQSLLNECPIHYIPSTVTIPSSKHSLVIEAKLTSKTLIKYFEELKRDSKKQWCLEQKPFLDGIVKVILINGGEESIDFIKNRFECKEGTSTYGLWKLIDDAQICVFFYPSISLEWFQDLNKKMNEDRKKIAKLEEDNKKIAKLEEDNKKIEEELAEIKKLLSNK